MNMNKSHNVFGDNTYDDDSEKTALERFEQELKGTIFEVLFVLLKEEDTTFWKFVAMMIIDFLQLLGNFSFASSINWPWKSPSVLPYLQTFLDLFQIVSWCAQLNFTTYIIVFYLCIFIVCLVILDIFYVSYSFSKKKFAFMWPLSALRSTCGLFVTVLFLPLLELFTSMLSCKEEDGEYRHSLFNDEKCWEGMHILHASFSILVSTIFINISLVVGFTYYETKSTSNDPSARTNSRVDMMSILQKIICIVLFTFFQTDEYRWLLCIVLIILSAIIYYKMSHERPYYNETIADIWNVLTGLFVWTNLCLLVAMALENTDFNGALQIYFLGFPLVIVLIATSKDHRKKLILKPLDQFDSGSEWHLKIRFYISLIHRKDMSRNASILLKGFIYDHESTCEISDCPLKIYVMNLASVLKEKKRKTINKMGTMDNYALLLNYANKLFLTGLPKFPTCTSLRIAYAFFLIERMNKQNLAITELQIAEKSHPPFDEQFVIYRSKKLIEDELSEGHIDGAGNGGNLDVVSVIAYENHFNQCKYYIGKAASDHMEFWSYLSDEHPDLAKLNKTGSKINSRIMAVEEHWTKLQKINPNVPKALRMYAEFLKEILNDNEGGQELLSRAKDTAMARNTFFDNNHLSGDINSYASDGTPCIFASGESNKLGEIVNFNMGICRVFGYTKAELQGRKVEMLMPELYAKHHEGFMQNAINNTEDIMQQAMEKFVLAKHKSGYLIPLHLQVRNIPSLAQGLQFVATFKPEKKNLNTSIGYLLLDQNKFVQGVSARCIEMVKMNNKLLRKCKCSITTLAPDLFDPSLTAQFNSKSGGTLKFYEPAEGVAEEEENSAGQSSGVGREEGKEENWEESEEGNQHKLRVRQGKECKQYNCHLQDIIFQEIGNAGYILRLESITEGRATSNPKINKFNKCPEFQFLFDPESAKYVTDIIVEGDNQKARVVHTISHPVEKGSHGAKKSKKHKRKTKKVKKKEGLDKKVTLGEPENENELAGDSEEESGESSSGEESESEESLSDDKTDMNRKLNPEKSGEEYSGSKSKSDVSPRDFSDSEMKSQEDKVHKRENYWRNYNYAEGIDTWRIVAGGEIGQFELVEVEDQQLLAKQEQDKQQLEEAGTEEEQVDEKGLDVVRNNIKSKKALNAAINNKTVPSAIKKLRNTGYGILFFLIAISSIEYGITITQFKDINENMKMVDYGYRRQTLQMVILYNINLIVLANQVDTVNIKRHAWRGSMASPTVPLTFEQLSNSSKVKIETALNEYYKVQNDISLSRLSLSDHHEELYNDKVVTLFFQESGVSDGNKEMKFTLTEAILQMTSSIFTVLNLDSPLYTLNNEDVYFVLYNGFADLDHKLSQSSNYYVQELYDRATNKSKVMFWLYMSSILVLLLSILILVPVVTEVSNARVSVLSLFLDIPIGNVKALFKKCERFVNNTHEEEEGDDMDPSDLGDSHSNKGEGGSLVDESTSRNYTRHRRQRKFKNNNTSNTSFFIKFFFGILVCASYFFSSYWLAREYLINIDSYTAELNTTSIAQSHDAHTLTVLQSVMGYTKILPKSHQQTFNILAQQTLFEMYEIAKDLQNTHNDNEMRFSDRYKDAFIDIMRQNLCQYKERFNFNLPNGNCDEFIDGTAKEGLHPVLIHFIETLRYLLHQYQNIRTNPNYKSPVALETEVEAEEETETECEGECETETELETETEGSRVRRYLALVIENDTKTEAQNKGIEIEILNSNDFVDLEVIAFDICESSFRYLIDEMIGSFEDKYTNETTRRVVLFVCFLVVLFIVFLALWTPFVNKLNKEIWRTKSMLTLIPIEVILQIKSVQKFLNNQSFFNTKGKH